VVVPVGGRPLGSELEQGFITQSVTNHLNEAGVVCLVVWGVVLWIDARRASLIRVISWALWGALALGQAVLFLLHSSMDRVLESDTHTILEPQQFHWMHRAYIATSSAQWLASLMLLALMLMIWQKTDRESNS
jgi:hypothetical protein